MNDIHKHLSARQDDIKLLLTFADQSLILCFAGLDLAATNSNKSPLALCAVAADHEFIINSSYAL